MIEYHADDYGLFEEQSRRILNCIEHGKINGISIMPNSPHLAECMDLLNTTHKVALTIHLNFVEGRALTADRTFVAGDSPAAGDKVFAGGGETVRNLLTDEKGNFNVSFGKLLLISYIPIVRGKYQKAIEREISLQIGACAGYFGEEPIRLDGHCHYQMLPIVFDAMMNVIRNENRNVSYIRIPYEEMSVYVPHKANLEYTKPINSVKVFLLNLLAKRAERKYPEWFAGHPRVPFAGVYLSGSMTSKNVDFILPQMTELSDGSAGGWGEMLFHPGAVLEPADIASLTSKDDVAFLTSPMRAKEAAAVSGTLVNSKLEN